MDFGGFKMVQLKSPINVGVFKMAFIYNVQLFFIAQWTIFTKLLPSGKSTISMAIFNSYVSYYQRVPGLKYAQCVS